MAIAWLVCATAAWSFAQGRGRTPRARPAPVVDAGIEDAAPAVAPVAPAEPSDAGALSPLTPGPNEMAPATDAGAPPDYDRTLSEIAQLRARIAALVDHFYKSRVIVRVRSEGDAMPLAKLTVSLDDGAVYQSPPNFRADDAVTVYDHAIAPGKHAVTIDAERKDARDDGFRASQRTRFLVDVPKDQVLELDTRITDDSTMGSDFPSDKSGRYDLRIRVKASARPAR